MKFILAPDSFKESMSAVQAANAMERGIKRIFPQAKCIKVPMADGGEGTVDALVNSRLGKIIKTKAISPLGDEITAEFGILEDYKTAVIEVASASGLMLINKEKRNPLLTTSYGTGQLIKAALDYKIEKLIIGLGGSATNDGGAGMLQALGAKLTDKSGKEIPFGGGFLHKLDKIDLSGLDKRLENISIEVACDVDNPLTGENGASKTFGRQKGGDKNEVEVLDNNLHHFANIIKQTNGKDVEYEPGAGAAGGMGASLIAFLGAKITSGVELIIEKTNLKEIAKDGDFIFTGEGSIDFQTKFGKTPVGVGKVGRLTNSRVIAFAGRVGNNIDSLYDYGIDAIVSIMQEACELEKALLDGEYNLEKAVESVCRIIKTSKNMT